MATAWPKRSISASSGKSLTKPLSPIGVSAAAHRRPGAVVAKKATASNMCRRLCRRRGPAATRFATLTLSLDRILVPSGVGTLDRVLGRRPAARLRYHTRSMRLARAKIGGLDEIRERITQERTAGRSVALAN